MALTAKELLEKRANLVHQARELLDSHQADGFLPTDVDDQYKRIMDDVNGITLDVERRNSFDERRQQLDAASQWEKKTPKRGLDPNPAAPEAGAKEVRLHKNADGVERRAACPKVRDTFERYVKGHGKMANPQAEFEYRGLLADTAGSGGDLIPPVEFIDQVIIPRDRQVLIRKWATVRRLTKSTDGYEPTIETNPDDADWTTEIVAVTEDTGLTTGKRELKPHVLTKLVKASIKELMVLPQVSELIADRLGYKFGVSEEKAFMTGAGTTKPLGVFVASTSGITTASDVSTANTTTAVTFDGLQAAKFTLPPPYWPERPLGNEPGSDLADRLDQGHAGPLPVAAQHDRGPAGHAAGLPRLLDVWAPSTMTAGSYVAVLGDFSYYHIADLVEPFSVQRLNELYAATNQVGFLGREYCDGMPVLSEAFVRVKLAAT